MISTLMFSYCLDILPTVVAALEIGIGPLKKYNSTRICVRICQVFRPDKFTVWLRIHVVIALVYIHVLTVHDFFRCVICKHNTLQPSVICSNLKVIERVSHISNVLACSSPVACWFSILYCSAWNCICYQQQLELFPQILFFELLLSLNL